MAALMERWNGKSVSFELHAGQLYYVESDFIRSFMEADRWPIMVRYDRRGVMYVPRDHYAFPPQYPGCSDSVWIVPGSTP